MMARDRAGGRRLVVRRDHLPWEAVGSRLCTMTDHGWMSVETKEAGFNEQR